MRKSLAFVALCIACASISFAQSTPKGLHFHRQGAGVPNAQGWVDANSTEGQYSVQIPCRFNDYTMDARDQEGPIARAFLVGCLRSNGSKFVVARAIYKAGGSAAKQLFENNVRNLSLAGMSSKHETTFNSYPTLDIKAQNEHSCAFMRYLLVGTTLVTMIAEAPRSQCGDSVAVESRTFFSSLKISP